jgi:hypothetical protein
MKQNLEKGDIVVVSNALTGTKEYQIESIEGNKAYSKFRVFNRKIYPGGAVYVFGERYSQWSNSYWIKQN